MKNLSKCIDYIYSSFEECKDYNDVGELEKRMIGIIRNSAALQKIEIKNKKFANKVRKFIRDNPNDNYSILVENVRQRFSDKELSDKFINLMIETKDVE